MIRARLHTWIRRARAHDGGASAVEFALVLPILLSLYLGGYEVSQASGVYRKLAITTKAVANITSQYTVMSEADIATVLAASAQVMAPYPSGNLSMVLSEISTDASGNATVTWSRQLNGTALVQGSTITLPSGMATPNTSYILSQANYSYKTTFGASFVPAMNMHSQLYMSPRQSSSISIQ